MTVTRDQSSGLHGRVSPRVPNSWGDVQFYVYKSSLSHPTWLLLPSRMSASSGNTSLPSSRQNANLKQPLGDTLRVLLATDSHVGYNERDPIRGDDSWKTFHEVMCLAKDRDVDMVLLSGDLFHDNKPSRKAMYQVMKTLRQNCYGEKPCEIEVLSDTSLEFQSAGGHVNYEDPDINVAIPVFSIHGNHDDPSGVGTGLFFLSFGERGS